MKKGFEKDHLLGNTLIDMYSKCGMVQKAHELLDGLLFRDVIVWTSLITGHAQQGQGENALACFECLQNEGILPNEVSFLCILNACCHSGLLIETQILFENMIKKYNITPNLEHYTCMVDLFSRAGHFYKAIALVEEMRVSDRLPLLLALLSACHKWANVELGKWAFEQSVQLDANCSAAYIGMANIYAAAGMQREADGIEALMVYGGLSNWIGC